MGRYASAIPAPEESIHVTRAGPEHLDACQGHGKSGDSVNHEFSDHTRRISGSDVRTGPNHDRQEAATDLSGPAAVRRRLSSETLVALTR